MALRVILQQYVWRPFLSNISVTTQNLLQKTIVTEVDNKIGKGVYNEDITDLPVQNHEKVKTFQELLDDSRLMKFGRPAGKCAIGKVVEVCNDDLYIDFGAKFEAVVKRPKHNEEFYVKGSKVRLILNKFEMTGAFLGDKRHITLCEADAVLLGPYNEVSESVS